MMRADRPDGVIIATPNQLHVENGLEAVEAGVPALVEKPIANSVMAASRLVEAAERTRAPLLTGHHRRHNPMIRKAKEIIDSSRLGTIRSVHGTCWFYKPKDYFDVPWRREKGGGLNLIHDVDNLRFHPGVPDRAAARRLAQQGPAQLVGADRPRAHPRAGRGSARPANPAVLPFRPWGRAAPGLRPGRP
jgi:predicted dehydrogenase